MSNFFTQSFKDRLIKKPESGVFLIIFGQCANPAPEFFSFYDDIFKKNYVTKTKLEKKGL